MNNLMAISLVPLAKKQLKEIIKVVMPLFKRVKVTSDMIILQEGLFKRKHKILPIDFLSEILPKEINRWAESKDIESPLPYFGNTVQFLLHLESIGERNLISYLWKCYMHVITLDTTVVESFIEDTPKVIINTNIITSVAVNKVVNELQRMRNNVRRTVKLNGLQYSLNVVYKSPDIRGSPKIKTYLAAA